MQDDKRRQEIEDAAYKLLIEKGFKATSMLAVAREAKASNETLYRWYGDKFGLFAEMIKRNSAAVEAQLLLSRKGDSVGPEALIAVGRCLLDMLTGDRAIALNRAAAGDPSGRLGKLLAQEGRSRVAPQIKTLIGDIFGPGVDLQACTETYLSLLIGDLQIRRATGAIQKPSKSEIDKRAKLAMKQLLALF